MMTQTCCQPCMMQTTCRQPMPQTPCGTPRMITTSLFAPTPTMQLTTLRQPFPQLRSPITPQRLLPPVTQRFFTPPLTPQRLMPPITQRFSLPTPMQRVQLFQPLLRVPQFYTALRWPVNPVTPVLPVVPVAVPLPQTPPVAMHKPLPDLTPRPVKPRTIEEQIAYSESALQRGLVAEGEGNYVLARGCYRNALIYPLTPAGRSAEKTLKRVETILEQNPHLAQTTSEPTSVDRTVLASTTVPTPSPRSSDTDSVRRNLHRQLGGSQGSPISFSIPLSR
jgi:hypothetical protein